MLPNIFSTAANGDPMRTPLAMARHNLAMIDDASFHLQHLVNAPPSLSDAQWNESIKLIIEHLRSNLKY